MADGFKINFKDFKWDPSGYRELNNSPGVKTELLSRANRVKASAESMGGTYSADVQSGSRMAHAMVKTSDFESRRANAKKNALAKASNAGR